MRLTLSIRSPSKSRELEERPGHGPDPSFCTPNVRTEPATSGVVADTWTIRVDLLEKAKHD